MEGGGAVNDAFKLGDIGDYRDTGDIWPIICAAFVSMNFGIAASRLGGIGGLSLNTYFDTFGLEGFLSNSAWIVILFQVARWLYTTAYTVGASRPWSPFIFICALIVVQLLHDLLFYFGLIRLMPSGYNDMVDALKKYANENGSRALLGHSIFLIFTGVLAMWFKETTFLFSLIVVNLALYMLPFVITTIGPKGSAAAEAAVKAAAAAAAKAAEKGGAAPPGPVTPTWGAWNGPRF